MKKSALFIIILLISDSCVDRIDFISSNAASQLVVEGQITDEPGPYTVKLSRTRKILDFSEGKPVSASKVVISDNVGNSEILTEIYPGAFQTKSNGIQGTIGREYTLRVETRDGKIFESSPEKINPSGTIDSIYYTFEKVLPPTGPPKYQFRIYIDSKGVAQSENLFRWKFTGTFKVQTSPELRTVPAGEGRIPDPPPCSGYNKNLVEVGLCQCCTCWVNFVDTKPTVSDNTISSGNSYKNVEVGIVPVEYWTFFDKVQVEVKQLSLSGAAFNYWKTVADQKEGSSSLFQPSIGKAVSNIFIKNGNEEVQGLFYASAITKKVIFLSAANIPLGSGVIPSAPPPIPESCLAAFQFSTTQKPITW
ncbi:MAG: DUF4249 domain-containing protein [Cyclobacteriaceae bacterium]